MRSSYTFSIICPGGGAVHQTAIARSRVTLGAILMAVFALCIVAGGADYLRLRMASERAAALKARILEQDRLIAMQRSQVQLFAKNLNGLKRRIADIGEFEQKIRIISGLDNDPQSSGLFGMGGAAPEDLDPRLPLTAEHGGLIRGIHVQARQLGDAAARQEQRFATVLDQLARKIDRLAATPSIRPAKGRISSRFANRSSPFTGQSEFHQALDIAADMGTPILATADGIITFAGNKWLMGKTIIIDHGHGIVTRYGHCQELLQSPGSPVKRGDIIAHMGNTGRSTGPHVHYEVRLNGVPVNPEHYILN